MSISMALEVLGSSGTFKATGRVASPEIFDSLAIGPKIRVRVGFHLIKFQVSQVRSEKTRKIRVGFGIFPGFWTL